NRFVYTISLYTLGSDGKSSRRTAFSTTLLPTRLAAADLTGSGRSDVVVADALDNCIQIAFQQPDGSFSAPLLLPTGAAPSDITVADANGDGLPDLEVSNQASGDVGIFLNDPDHAFTSNFLFRAGTGLYGLATTPAGPTVLSLVQSVSLAAGAFTGTG